MGSSSPARPDGPQAARPSASTLATTIAFAIPARVSIDQPPALDANTLYRSPDNGVADGVEEIIALPSQPDAHPRLPTGSIGEVGFQEALLDEETSMKMHGLIRIVPDVRDPQHFAAVIFSMASKIARIKSEVRRIYSFFSIESLR